MKKKSLFAGFFFARLARGEVVPARVDVDGVSQGHARLPAERLTRDEGERTEEAEPTRSASLRTCAEQGRAAPQIAKEPTCGGQGRIRVESQLLDDVDVT